MASKRLAKMSVHELNERWNQHAIWIAEEANFMAIHRARYRTVERWLFRHRRRRIANRSLQAYCWISRLWLVEGLVYVRRELDDQHGTINLNQLFREIAARPDALPGLSTDAIEADRKTLYRQSATALAFA